MWGVVYVYDGRAHREESFATLVPCQCLQPMLRRDFMYVYYCRTYIKAVRGEGG